MLRRSLALALVVAIALLGVPSVTSAAGPRAQATGGQVGGAARTGTGSPIANATVRLRNTGTGQAAGTATTAVNGEFSFKNVPAGNYVVELVDNSGAVIATSAPVSLTGSESVTGVAITATVGKAGVGAVPATGQGSFFRTSTGILILAAAGAGLGVGAWASLTQKSPSR